MSRTESSQALLELTRPFNAFITALTVVVGGIIAGKDVEFSVWRLIVAGLSAALVAGGGNAINDAFDIAIDLVNRPKRPIPSGRISRFVAFLWGVTLMFCGVGIGWLLGREFGIVASSVAVLLYLYDYRLKRTLLLGNVAVALCGGLAFVYGGLAAGNYQAALIPAGFAFLIHLGREIVKDVEDEAGDRVVGARTLPIVASKRAALGVAAGVLIGLASLTPIPFVRGVYGQWYFVMVMPFVATPLIILAFQLAYGLGTRGLRRVSFSLKIIMLTGLASLYVG